VAYVLGINFHPYVFFCMCFPCVCLAAASSWHLVEKPFLRLKKPHALASIDSAAPASAMNRQTLP
jgi:peptidoglycan/LPS O-acetylase OafA/YrhL